MKFSNIIFKREKVGKQSFYNPAFLTTSDTPLIESAIEWLNSNLHTCTDEFDRDSFLHTINDYKLGQGLIDVLLTYFYSFKSEITQIKPAYELRMKFYEFAHSLQRGFFLTDEQDTILAQFLETLHLKMDLDSLKQQMFQDHRIYETLHIERTPSISDVIGHYNHDVLESLLKRSLSVTFQFHHIPPAPLLKQLFFLSKKFNVYSEFDKDPKSNLINYQITGPLELIGKQTKYGQKIAELFFKMLSHLLTTQQPFEIFIKFKARNTTRCCHLTSEEFPSLQIPKRFAISPEPSFDSQLERQFFKEISYIFPNWTIQREADPLLIKNTIFIPDFKLSYKEIELYIELIGFWTQTYLEKKIKKLKSLAPMPNLLLLVDEKLELPSLPFPTFTYGTSFPLSQIANFIRDTYLQPYQTEELEYLRLHLPEISKNCLEALKNKFVLYEDELISLAGISITQNLQSFIQLLKPFLTENKLRYIPNIGIIKAELFLQIKSKLSPLFKNTREVKLSAIQKALQSLINPAKLPIILPLLGYQINWKSFLTPLVSRKKEK